MTLPVLGDREGRWGGISTLGNRMAVPPVRRGVRGRRQAHRRSGPGLSGLRSPAHGLVGLCALAAPRRGAPDLGAARPLPCVPAHPCPAARLRARAAPGRGRGDRGRPRVRHRRHRDAGGGAPPRPRALDGPRLAPPSPGPGVGHPRPSRGGRGLARRGAARPPGAGRGGGAARARGGPGGDRAPAARPRARSLAAVERHLRRLGAGHQHEPALGRRERSRFAG